MTRSALVPRERPAVAAFVSSGRPMRSLAFRRPIGRLAAAVLVAALGAGSGSTSGGVGAAPQATAAGSSAPAPSPGAPPGGPDSYFSDYFFNVLGEGSGAWPYFGGRGDRLADLGAWKFLAEKVPGELDSPSRLEALRQAVLLALADDDDGVDLFLKDRLFLEMSDLLDAEGAFPPRVDPATCEVPEQIPETAPGGSGAPSRAAGPAGSGPAAGREGARPGAGPGGERLSVAATLEMEGLLQVLCRACDMQGRRTYLEATLDLTARWRELDARTAALDEAARGLLSPAGLSFAELTRRSEAIAWPPGAATVLDWVEEFDTVLASGAMRRRLRPDWMPLADLAEQERRHPSAQHGSPIACRLWLDPAAVVFDPERFLDAYLEVGESTVRVVPRAPIPFGDPATSTAPEVIAARLAFGLYTAAWRSASVESKKLMHSEPKAKEVRFLVRSGVRLDPGAPAGAPAEASPPAEVGRRKRTLACWTGNPLSLKALLVRRTDRLAFLREFGVAFGNPLDAFRERLRERVIRFDAPDLPAEKQLYALARLGVSPLLSTPAAPEIEKRLFPWLDPATLARLRAAWAARLRAGRADQIHDFMDEALGGLGPPSDLPAPPLRQFRLRTAEEIAACVEPYLLPDEMAEDRAAFQNARRNLNDALHDALAGRLAEECLPPRAEAGGDAVAADARGKPARPAGTSGPRADLLLRRTTALAGRLLPGATPAQIAELVGGFGLDRPCSGAAAALLRFGAFYDVMTAVFALESRVAGGSFDSAFDRREALATGTSPFADLDRWLGDYRSQAGARLEPGPRDPRDASDPDPDDCLPDLAVDPESLRLPPPDARDVAALSVAWTEAFAARVSGRDYPADLAATGWRAWDDYIEEEQRHRRIELLPAASPGFRLRAVFGTGLRYTELLDPEGAPAAGAEWIAWSRVPGDGAAVPDRYVIEHARPGGTDVRWEIPIPTHPRAPGKRSLGAALDWAETYFR